MRRTNLISQCLRQVHRQVIHRIIEVIDHFIIDSPFDIRQVDVCFQGVIILQEVRTDLIAFQKTCPLIPCIVFIVIVFQHFCIRMISDYSFAVTEHKAAVCIFIAPVYREVMEEVLHCILQSCTAGIAVFFKNKFSFQRCISIRHLSPLWQEHVSPQYRRTSPLTGRDIAHTAILRLQRFIQRYRITAAVSAEQYIFIGIGIDKICLTFLATSCRRHDCDIVKSF